MSGAPGHLRWGGSLAGSLMQIQEEAPQRPLQGQAWGSWSLRCVVRGAWSVREPRVK